MQKVELTLHGQTSGGAESLHHRHHVCINRASLLQIVSEKIPFYPCKKLKAAFEKQRSGE